jgi:RNA polymerase sigma factor (sigma-70 family)
LADPLWQDKVLIRRFNRGDPEALRRIYARYRVSLVTLATGLLFDKSRAEDVVHEVFARIVEDRARISIASNLRGYLFRAVANTARNVNRTKTGRSLRDADPPEAGLQVVPSPDGQAMQAEQCGKLPSALQQLPYEQREVILLRHYAGLRFRAIAKCQGASISTVQGRYRYGLEKLRSLLGVDP